MSKFTKLDQFIAEKEQRAEQHAQLVAKEQSALEQIQALKAKYEATLRDGVVAGKDTTKDLDAIQDEIDNAEKAFERRKQERNLFSHVIPRNTTEDDVVNSWNNEFIPAFTKEKFDPVLKRLLLAKKELADAVLEYHSVVNEFKTERNATRGELSDMYYYKLNEIGITSVRDTEKYFVTENDLHYLQNGSMPPSLVNNRSAIEEAISEGDEEDGNN